MWVSNWLELEGGKVNILNMLEKFDLEREAGLKGKDILFACGGEYYGGHMGFGTRKYDQVTIGITKNFIVAVKTAFLKRNKWIMKIPIKKILVHEVRVGSEEAEGRYDTISSIYATGGLGLKGKVNMITIPFIDNDGIKQTPKFSTKKFKDFSKIFYEQIKKIKPVTKEKADEDDSIKILKIRYAKGEVTKKQFREMRKDLEK